MLNERAAILLKTLVEKFISEGSPVGSRTLAKCSGLDVSAATVRNIMADLEDMGLVTSPHASAGRVPTPRGYRFFVDTLLTVRPPSGTEVARLEQLLQPESPGRLLTSASKVLSDLTRFAGIVVIPKRRAAALRQIEFLRLSGRRVLLIIVAADGEVQNRILPTDRLYSAAELRRAANFFNHHCGGLSFPQARQRLQAEIRKLHEDVSALMNQAVNATGQAMSATQDDWVLSGERNLLNSSDLSANVKNLRKLFDLFEDRARLLQLLDLSQRAQGVQIFIGGESDTALLDECSMITAPYEVDGEVVGTLGVIGPTRMAYERVIPIVDITAKLLSSALGRTH